MRKVYENTRGRWLGLLAGKRRSGSQALAVISCALALLVAQPAARGTLRGAKNAHVTVGVFGSVAAPQLRLADRPQRLSTAIRPESILTSARHLHILATMEILHRLLAQELRPNEIPVAAVLIQPLCLLAFESPIALPRFNAAPTPPPAPVERQFAITRHLLAPPAV